MIRGGSKSDRSGACYTDFVLCTVLQHVLCSGYIFPKAIYIYTRNTDIENDTHS